MTFYSILYESADLRAQFTKETEPAFFSDLNLDQLVEAITGGWQEYDLKSFFYSSLHDVRAIQYRQEIMRDLRNKKLFQIFRAFSLQMETMRQHLAQKKKSYYHYQKESWFLDAVEVYCDAVGCLTKDLVKVDLKARGLIEFRDFLSDYVKSEAFRSLFAEVKELKEKLRSVKYSVILKENAFTVRHYHGEDNFSTDVEKTFAKFKQGAVKSYLVELPLKEGMNHIEAKILEFVAALNPDIFTRLDRFCETNAQYQLDTIQVFDREIQFYTAYLLFIQRFEQKGLRFCFPVISTSGKDVCDMEGFDLALANKLAWEQAEVVANDFFLNGKERIFIVTGPNQGGKTTFARTFGQLHFLASLGLLVPGRKAKLYLYDRIFTQFEKEEEAESLRGKLKDDLVRVYSILDEATSDSLLIFNEIFNSTTFQDALFLSQRILERVFELDSLGVYVTFLDELSRLSEKTVSMVSTVVPENPAQRTYKIIRKPADGLSYALSIAEKYHLTKAQLKERLNS